MFSEFDGHIGEKEAAFRFQNHAVKNTTRKSAEFSKSLGIKLTESPAVKRKSNFCQGNSWFLIGPFLLLDLVKTCSQLTFY